MPTELNLERVSDSEDRSIYRGDSYAVQFTLIDTVPNPDEPFDPTGYTFASQLRKSLHAAASVAFAVDVDTSDPLETLVTITLTPAQTAAMVGAACPRVWDFQATAPDGMVETWFAGSVEVSGDVTH